MSIRTKILFFASNPEDVTKLSLDEEIRAITTKIRTAEYRDVVDLISRWAVRPDDLVQALLEINPTIVHFSGHGSASGELVLMDDSAKTKKVSSAALNKLFLTLKDNIKVVVLNACYSKIQGQEIAKVIDCVVGMNSSIGDRAAITFAASFYSAIGFGRSVKEAFELGKVSLMLEGIPEENTPELLHRPEVDPANVYLVHTTDVDYKKIYKIDADGIGNIIFQDINGNKVTVNYNDIEKLKTVLQNLSDTQTFELKQIIGTQHKEILTEIRRIQDRSDEKNTIQKAEKILNDLDDFFKELTAIKIESIKGRIISNYNLLREYEEMLILEDDPKRKMKYEREIKTIRNNIANNEMELTSISKQS
jgi:hypothetical protein